MVPSRSVARVFPDVFLPGARRFMYLTEAPAQLIVQGDCQTVMARMRPGSIDLAITSPPYNIDVSYATYQDRLSPAEYLAWLVDVTGQIYPLLRNDGSFFLNVGGTSADPWKPMEIALALRPRWVLQNHIVWVKSITISDQSHGHFKPMRSRRYLNRNFEHIWHFTKTGEVAIDRLAVGVPYQDKSNIRRFGHAEDRRCAGNVWFMPYRTIQSRADRQHHPAPYPVELARRCIALHGKPNALVLDPFLGSGSTLVAARQAGCRGIGIEVDAGYCRTSYSRLLVET